MSGIRKAVVATVRGDIHPALCPICGPTAMVVAGPWLRDSYVCVRCRSVPRQRALVQVVKRELPSIRTARVLESSPDGASSRWLARHCAEYVPSQLFDDVPRGECTPDGVRSEDLQRLTFPDEAFDVVVTQDVFEHILEPDLAMAEIARVLRPGGAHVWTVPLFADRVTVRRAEPDGVGGVRHLLPPDYHSNPLGGGSLVVHEWGLDLLARVDRVSGLVTARHARGSRLRGVRGEMHDVLVSRKAASGRLGAPE